MLKKVEDCGVVKDRTWGFFFFPPLHPEDIAIGGKGREGGKERGFLSLISRTAPSALITGSQRQPEVKGEWMDEQHPKRGEKKDGEKGKKAMFIPLRLHQMTAAFQFNA